MPNDADEIKKIMVQDNCLHALNLIIIPFLQKSIVYYALYSYLVNKKNQKYRCGLEIPGYNYVGIGNSKLKKSAQKKAIKDFLLFLVSQNLIPTIPKVKKNVNT